MRLQFLCHWLMLTALLSLRASICEAKTDYLLFTSEKTHSLFFGKITYENGGLTLRNVTLVDNALNYPRNVVAYPKTNKIYVCDTIYGDDVTQGFIYEYAYTIGIF